MVVQPPPSSTSSSNESGPSSPTSGIHQHRRPPVVIQQVVMDDQFVQSVQNFDSILQSGNVLEYCDRQIASTTNSQDEQILWRFLRASFEVDPKPFYIELLGFRRDEIFQRIQTLNKEEKNGLPTEGMNGLHLGENATKKKSSYGSLNQPSSDFLHDCLPDVEMLLNRSIMLGQFEGAVELCLNEEKYAEALLLAHLGGQELLLNTQKKFFEKVQTSSTKVRLKFLRRTFRSSFRRISVDRHRRK